MCGTVTSQLVGDESKRFLPLTLSESSEKPSCRTPIPAGLYENIDHVAVVIDGSPEIVAFAVDGDEDLD